MTGSATETTPAPLDDSAFHMWRCVIAVAHADSEVGDAELSYLTRVFADHGLSADQRTALGEDLLPPGPDIALLLPKVTQTAHREQLFYFGGLMAQQDGEIDPREEAILRKIGAGHLTPQQMSAWLDEAKQAIENRKFREALKASEVKKGSGFKAVVDAFLVRIALLPP
jgi:uncharacterized membrane protein YebE (DUF533 family)